MAKKSSNNAVKKIDEQIKKISSNNVDDSDKSLKLNRKELNEQVLKEKTINNQSNKKSGNKSSKENKTTNQKNIANKQNKSKQNVNKYKKNKKYKNNNNNNKNKQNVTSQNKTTEVSESTIKIKKLETEIRSLYDRVNDIVDDIDTMTKINVDVDESSNNTMVHAENNYPLDNTSILDGISTVLLDRVLKGLFITFSILFIIFIIFVVFVSTF